MFTNAQIKDQYEAYRYMAREFYRAMVRSFRPAFGVKVDRENDFLSRLLAMTLLTAALGAALYFLPRWPLRFWCEGALLGIVLSITATRRSNAALIAKTAMGIIFGVGLQVFTSLGHPLVGMALLGLGIGAQISKATQDSNIKMDTVLATIFAAVLAAWSVSKLGPAFVASMPGAVAVSLQWAIIGMFFSLGAIPAHVSLSADRLLIHARRIRRKLRKQRRADIDPLMDRYLELGNPPEGEDVGPYIKKKSMMGEALVEAAETSMALQEVEDKIAAVGPESLTAHRDDLKNRMETEKDPAIKSEINRALMGIEEALARLEKLRTESERLKLKLFRIEMDTKNRVA